MSFRSLLVHDVTILRAGTTTDEYGNLVLSWSSPTSNDVPGRVSQRSRSEDNDNRRAEVSEWVAFFLADTDIVAGDRVRWNNPTPTITFEVDGPPNRAWDAAVEHHVEVQLRVVVG